ncbi:MAG: hypothetical protein P1V97_01820, partial [Planctomycetota bacterium]|nr:hypothetical protein [Planctomycetota bacterium]
MSQQWPFYLQVFKYLYISEDCTVVHEALLRSAVSRIYYAAFHVTSIFLETNSPKFLAAKSRQRTYQSNRRAERKVGSHELVISHLIALGDKYERLGMELQRVKNAREQADYKTRGFSERFAEVNINRAKAIISELGGCTIDQLRRDLKIPDNDKKLTAVVALGSLGSVAMEAAEDLESLLADEYLKDIVETALT